jgi:hypothetical protein
MNFRFSKVILLCLAPGLLGCRSDRPPQEATAEDRAVRFLAREVPAWSRENGCFSCHNNGDAARALYAARAQGYRVGPQALSETSSWVQRPDEWANNKGDPGFSDQRLATIQFAASLLAALDSGLATERAALSNAAQKVASAQHEDGAWHVEPQNPVGSPATYGTTLATFMAWRVLRAADRQTWQGAMASAERWLGEQQPNDIPNAAVLMLWLNESAASNVAKKGQALDFIVAAQGADGGWGPYRDAPPEVFDTALALLALATVTDRPRIRDVMKRGRKFLQSEQLPDGSWRATTRPPGGESYAQQISTTGWAALALLGTER